MSEKGHKSPPKKHKKLSGRQTNESPASNQKANTTGIIRERNDRNPHQKWQLFPRDVYSKPTRVSSTLMTTLGNDRHISIYTQ